MRKIPGAAKQTDKRISGKPVLLVPEVGWTYTVKEDDNIIVKIGIQPRHSLEVVRRAGYHWLGVSNCCKRIGEEDGVTQRSEKVGHDGLHLWFPELRVAQSSSPVRLQQFETRSQRCPTLRTTSRLP